MDLAKCTEGQRETVLTLDAPLMVAAGAGSGKTFTLTQRIVHAFEAGTGATGEPFVSSIDEVVAITFTKKAAAELRSRIKALLASEGFAEEALAVDEGWISTIHGMASRILRENALDLGIDPAFEVVSASLQEELRREAVETIVAEAATLQDDEMRAFLASEPLFGRGERGTGLVDDAQALIDRAMSMPEGLDGVTIASSAHAPRAVIERMAELGETFLAHAQGWTKPGKYEQKALDDMETALEGARAWLAGEGSGSASFADVAFDAAAFRDVLYAFPFSSKSAPTQKNRTEFFDDYNIAYAELAEDVEAGLGERRARMLFRFARLLDERYEELLGPHRFDQSGLLRRCVRALEEHPHIAARYRERFKLIMVDEFQDTDNLQVRLISLIAREGLANVCVVGDAQQSIYRFRGADVNVFFDYEKKLRRMSAAARFPRLTENFRSHRDVLGFVETIFSQPEVFGKRFLKLEAKGAVNATENPLFAAAAEENGSSRVTLDILVHHAQVRNETKVRVDEARAVAAEHIADHFAQLAARGAKTQDMALLLGSMKAADTYASALRERGIESIITGGSVFSGTRAAQSMGALLRCAVNRDDGLALFEVLTSPLFALSDDCLLYLSTRYDELGRIGYRDLAQGFSRALVEEHHEGLSDNDARALDLAAGMLDRFVRAAARSGKGSASRALRTLFAETGLLARLQAQGAEGMAQAGNLQKACAIVEDLEEAATGIATLSFLYDEHIRTAKEAPGILSLASSLPLRIMTIHSSKGLQFAHVAVAEAGAGKERGRSLIVENIGQRTYVSDAEAAMKLGEHRKRRKELHDALAEADERWTDSERIAEALSAGEQCGLDAGSVRMALGAWAREEARSEAHRLLYVALTRAVESVFLQVRMDAKSDDGYASAGIYHDVYTAFPWDTAARRSNARIDFGGSAPAEVRYEELIGPIEGGSEEEVRVPEHVPASFIVPIVEQLPMPHMLPHGFGRENVRSYSSLDHDAFAASHAIDVPDSASSRSFVLDEAQQDASLLSHGADEDATALGTAFHRLAQRAIVLASRERAPHALIMPDAATIEAQARAQSLSEGQRERLHAALKRWFDSALAREFDEHAHIAAEVPFMVRIERADGDALYLEGEIDGLADDGDGRALFIDYKTGGSSDETADQLHVKHLQQAQCYAYALMREGYTAVEARFVRVEQPAEADPTQPSVVKYSFEADDMAALEREVLAAAR